MEQIKAENERRNEALRCSYDPLRGEGCDGERLACKVGGETLYLPVEMLKAGVVRAHSKPATVERHRLAYDFEYWCARCVKIKDKISGREVAFVLNRPQRRVLGELERMRKGRQPIRMIMLKARQWGGSTLVQMYMAWLQIVHRTHCNSVICGHLKDTSAAIKGMYRRLLDRYPDRLATDRKGVRLHFKTFEKSRNVSEIVGRDCVVITASAESQEAIRGYDIALAHLTEIAFWRATSQKSPESLIRAVCGSVAMEEGTAIILESTANGVGNYFHTEWLRAKAGQSDKVPVFVPWYEIEIYRKKVEDVAKAWNSLDDYELELWKKGLTLEMIAWYHAKRKEYNTHHQMQAEYPSDDIEAFVNTGRNVFSLADVERLRSRCYPAPYRGEVEGLARDGSRALEELQFVPTDTGDLKVWRMPESASGAGLHGRYIVTVDVGGLSDSSDYSVISVLDTQSAEGLPEIVAQWRGHTYHDLLAWKAAQIAQWYGRGLLVVESNTLETEYTEGDGSAYILDIVSAIYGNVYVRAPSPSDPAGSGRVGFHTNVSTKEKVVYSQMRVLRDGMYIEHDSDALDEYCFYEKKSRGYGAIRGRHDDILMTRCIGMYVHLASLEEKQRHVECDALKYQDNEWNIPKLNR